VKLATAAQKIVVEMNAKSFFRGKIPSKIWCDKFSFTDLHEHIHLSVTIFRKGSDMVLLVRGLTTKHQESLCNKMPLATTNIPDPLVVAAESALSPSQQPVRPAFFSNVATVLGGQVACALVALAIEICYARLLGPAGRGQVSLCMMIIAVCAVFAGLGGEIPLTIWTASQKKKPRAWLSAVSLIGSAGCFVSAALWGAVYWWWHPEFLRGITPSLAVLVFAAIPLSVFFTYLLALLTGMERFQLRAGVSLLSQIAELAGILLLVFALGRMAQVAVAGNLLGLFVAGTVGAVLLRQPLRDSLKFAASLEEIKAALHLGVRALGNLASFFSYRLDVFVVNYFLDPAHVGWYALGVVISESLWQIPQAAAIALYPRTARTIDHGAGEFTCFVTRQCLLLATVLALFMALLSPVLVPLLFGAPFSPSVAVIWWILPGTIALALGKVMSADITARGRPEFNSIAALSGGLMTVLLDFLLIPRMGINGAALASSVTYLLEAILIAAILQHLLKVSWRSFLVPTRADFAAYRAILTRGRSWFQSMTGSSERSDA
jgi:O-antigen/teichoic acid export membrane protein